MESELKKCSDRIDESLQDTEQSLKDLFDTIDGDNVSEDESETQSTDNAYEELNNYALGVNTKKVTTITLSWGGPASFLEVEHDDLGIDKITYRFSDWFDTATVEVLDQESMVWRYVEQVMSGMGEDF